MVRQILGRFDETRSEFGSHDQQRVKLENRMMDYTQLGNLAEFSFGRPGRLAIEMALVLTQCGFCIIYFIFIGSTIQQVRHSFSAVVEKQSPSPPGVSSMNIFTEASQS